MEKINVDNFKSQPVNTRIEAVIADGQWYFFGKWCRVAAVKEKDLKEWINKNHDVLIHDVSYSKKKKRIVYRAKLNFIENWYKTHGLDYSDKIIPNNYPARIWDGKTETDHYIDNPRRMISKLTIKTDNLEIQNKIIDSVLGSSSVEGYGTEKLFIFCLDAAYVSDLIRASLNEEELAKITINTRNGFKRRDMSVFSEEFYKEAYEFYLPFVRNVTRGSRSTLNMYLDSNEEIDALFMLWIYEAIEKFDEKQNLPFSGYLASAIKRWPYDLPVKALGRVLNDFQKKRRRVVHYLEQKNNITSVSDEEMAKIMDMDLDEYNKLAFEYEVWEGKRNAASLESKAFSEVLPDVKNVSVTKDFDLAHKISIAIMKTSLELNDKVNTDKIIDKLGNFTNFDTINLDDKYKETLMRELS